MKIITRTTAIKNLKKHIGQDLRKLALEHSITTYETGKQNKGWKGRCLGTIGWTSNKHFKSAEWSIVGVEIRCFPYGKR